MRTNSGQTALESAWAATESMATQCDVASDRAIREIDAYVLGLHIHVRLSRCERASSREEAQKLGVPEYQIKMIEDYGQLSVPSAGMVH